MISKSQIQFIKSLRDKKIRDEHKLFVAEGKKLVADMLTQNADPYLICGTKQALSQFPAQLLQGVKLLEVSDEKLAQASSQKTPQGIIALFRQPEQEFDVQKHVAREIVFCLDGIQNPGNLGTIIRSADWFGFRHMIASHETADVFNHKVIQAGMGAILRVKIKILSLFDVFESAVNQNISVAGAFMSGTPYNRFSEMKNGFVVIGNEGEGISPDLFPFIKNRISIPPAPTTKAGMESLNAAVAASILMSEFCKS